MYIFFEPLFQLQSVTLNWEQMRIMAAIAIWVSIQRRGVVKVTTSPDITALWLRERAQWQKNLVLDKPWSSAMESWLNLTKKLHKGLTWHRHYSATGEMESMDVHRCHRPSIEHRPSTHPRIIKVQNLSRQRQRANLPVNLIWMRIHQAWLSGFRMKQRLVILDLWFSSFFKFYYFIIWYFCLDIWYDLFGFLLSDVLTGWIDD